MINEALSSKIMKILNFGKYRKLPTFCKMPSISQNINKTKYKYRLVEQYAIFVTFKPLTFQNYDPCPLLNEEIWEKRSSQQKNLLFQKFCSYLETKSVEKIRRKYLRQS